MDAPTCIMWTLRCIVCPNSISGGLFIVKMREMYELIWKCLCIVCPNVSLCRNLQSFLIQLQDGTFLHFFMQHLLLAVLYERMASVLVAPTRNLPPNKPFSSKMILQVANFYQSSLPAPMGRCKSCWATIQAHKCVFILLPINPHNIHQIKTNEIGSHQKEDMIKFE